ncbi:unnamed protein product [Strongylus vulgaris]|uniref:MARVEL domain-containing protein n=1 Tax=Strongylus vulgaris TaxID=40348 RepID=A0A3P7IHE2_STRVU|nr:unnamed protein product [Strongylus vulgaris]
MNSLDQNGSVVQKGKANPFVSLNAGTKRLINNICMKSQRNMIKFVEMAVCITSLVLVAISNPVWNERDMVLLVCSVALLGSFAFLVSYIFAFDELISSTPWFIVEATYGSVFAVALFTCALAFLIITSSHWADVNPLRQAIAAFAAVRFNACLFTTARYRCFAIDHKLEAIFLGS